jgi:hypothetical protein
MDLLDVIEAGADQKGRIGRVFAVAGFVLLLGWAQRWPVAYPLVQAAYEGRIERLTDFIVSSLPGSGQP